MRIRVQLFARARDLARRSCLEMEIASPVTVGELRRQIAQQCPALQGLLERSALAVDQEFAANDHVLQPDAEVALLPPVSGGQ